MITSDIVKEYNSFRRCGDKSVLCHAPFTNIYFNQSGNGVACCYNSTDILGTYPEQSIKEMWFGEKANQLREAIRNNDLSGGCSGCAHQLTSRNFSGQMSVFDRYADARESRSWFQRIRRRFKPQKEISLPKAMEFSLTNVCNLGCVMCSGYFSSVIRRDREKLPPMKSPYDLDFVEQLEEFIPSLSVAKFFGGEPFLIRIYDDIWERIRRLNPALEVHITTNATLLTERAKDLLDSLNCHLIVSIDSLEKETYEKIRKNASYEQVMHNVAYLEAYSAKHGRTLSFAVCPMQQNWQEIPQMVAYCNQHAIVIWFNTVYYPAHCSLRSMSAADLAQVVDYWKGVELPAEEWLATSNRNRFTNLLNQVAQWRDEALQAEQAILPAIPDLFKPASEQIDAASGHEQPGKEMSRVFSQILTFENKKNKENKALKQNQARYGAYDTGSANQLNEFLSHQLAHLSEEPFVRHYFNALKEAYTSSLSTSLAVNQELSPAPLGLSAVTKKNEFFTKVDLLSPQVTQHHAREAIVKALVKRDIREVLYWIENNSLQTIEHVIDARYG